MGKKKRTLINNCRKKRYDYDTFIEILKANGYVKQRQRGSHEVYVLNAKKITVNKDLNPMVALRLIKENDLDVTK